MDNSYLFEEMKYQATSIVLECEQKLNGGFFSNEYIEEKLDTLNGLLFDIKKIN